MENEFCKLLKRISKDCDPYSEIYCTGICKRVLYTFAPAKSFDA